MVLARGFDLGVSDCDLDSEILGGVGGGVEGERLNCSLSMFFISYIGGGNNSGLGFLEMSKAKSVEELNWIGLLCPELLRVAINMLLSASKEPAGETPP